MSDSLDDLLAEANDALTPVPAGLTQRVERRLTRARRVRFAVRATALAANEGVGVRLLQRRFADHVGLGPKTVIRRYRLYEAAERARRGAPPDWARLAAELGFSDQSHLTREFTAVIGVPPARYAALGRSGGRAAG